MDIKYHKIYFSSRCSCTNMYTCKAIKSGLMFFGTCKDASKTETQHHKQTSLKITNLL